MAVNGKRPTQKLGGSDPSMIDKGVPRGLPKLRGESPAAKLQTRQQKKPMKNDLSKIAPASRLTKPATRKATQVTPARLKAMRAAFEAAQKKRNAAQPAPQATQVTLARRRAMEAALQKRNAKADASTQRTAKRKAAVAARQARLERRRAAVAKRMAKVPGSQAAKQATAKKQYMALSPAEKRKMEAKGRREARQKNSAALKAAPRSVRLKYRADQKKRRAEMLMFRARRNRG
tara:strand:+ start:146 stop:844 length:699 start_codon:yes stop_codon:yes gene_type:complete